MNLLESDWTIEFHSGIPAYRQIMNRIEAEIAAGNLKLGDQLPPIRSLHQKLNVNPNTVARAYRDLAQAGVIESQQGSGCYVAPPRQTPAPLAPKARMSKADEIAARLTAEARSHGISIDDLVVRLRKGGARA